MQRSLTKLNWRALLLLLAFGLVVYFIYKAVRERTIPFFSPPTYQSRVTYPTEPITLTYWRPDVDPKALDAILADYKALHPNITVKLVNQPAASYDKLLSDNQAKGTLPDIFTVRNDWLPRYQKSLVPAPTTVFTPQEYRDTFVDVAQRDLTTGDTINGLTFGISTLGLYYNADIFEAAKIAQPPKNWQEFADVAKKLTTKNGQSISRAGVALGTPGVTNYVDILSVLMMQNGAQMTDSPPTKATFGLPDANNYYPAARAVDYFNSFSNPNKSVYAWNDALGNPVDAFAQGKLAMLIDYGYRAPLLERQNPALNYKVASLPQLPGRDQINYASHWDELVNKNSKHTELAWDLLRFISSREELNKYSLASYRPARRRDMVDKQRDDRSIGVFAGQVNTSRTWYQGNNYNVEGIFADLINGARGGLDAAVSTKAAATRVTQEIARSRQ